MVSVARQPGWNQPEPVSSGHFDHRQKFPPETGKTKRSSSAPTSYAGPTNSVLGFDRVGRRIVYIYSIVNEKKN